LSSCTAGLVEPIPPFPSPFQKTSDGLRVRVRLTPKAGRNRIEGIVVDAGGGAQLKVSVTAVPKKGKANKALLKLLSKEWGVGIRGLRLITGAKDRNKTIGIDGDSTRNLTILETWLGERN